MARPERVIDAATHSEVELLRRYASTGMDLDIRGPNNTTALHEAVRGRYDDCVRILVEHGASVNVVDSSGKTPLSYARDLEVTAIIKYLLSKHAGIHAMQSVLKGHESDVRGVIFSADGQYILSESIDSTVRLWDVDTGMTRVTTPKTQLETIWNGRCGKNVHVFLIDDLGSTVSEAYGQRMSVQCLSAYAEPHFHYAKLRFPWLDCISVNKGPTISEVLCGKDRFQPWVPVLRTPCLSPEVIQIADRMVHRFGSTVFIPMMRSRLSFDAGRYSALTVSPDSNWLATTSRFNLEIWTLSERGDRDLVFTHVTSLPRSVVFSADSKRIAVLECFDNVKVFEVSSGNQTHILRPQNAARPHAAPPDYWKDASALAFSPNGRLLASACSDNTLRLWKL